MAADASRRAALLVAYIRKVCALLAPCRAGASTPTVAILFRPGSLDPADIVAYRLTSDAPAQVTTHSNDSKSVLITGGTATLAEHQGNPGGYVEVDWGIPLRLSMRFDRVTVP